MIVLILLLVVVVIMSFLHFSFFFSFRSFYPFCVNKMGMMTTAMSFASLHGDVVHHEGSGIKEISNLHWISLIYCSGCLPRNILLWILTMSLVNLLFHLDLLM